MRLACFPKIYVPVYLNPSRKTWIPTCSSNSKTTCATKLRIACRLKKSQRLSPRWIPMRRFRCSRIWMRRRGKKSSIRSRMKNGRISRQVLRFLRTVQVAGCRRSSYPSVRTGMWGKQSITSERKKIFPRNFSMSLWWMQKINQSE